MRLSGNRHLAYCTNIHRGDNWQDTFDSLKQYTLAVKENISSDRCFAIGLRLSHTAAVELSDKSTLLKFQKWLDKNNCYVFTINGFPFGSFHGKKVKENVYLPDWTSTSRLEYTNLLFDILCQILPDGLDGSVSTVPISFKRFINNDDHLVQQACENLHKCIQHIENLSNRYHCSLNLGLEPEPLGYLETSSETIDFFNRFVELHPHDERILEYLGVTYDTCHLAIEYENPKDIVSRFHDSGISINKIHISSALKVKPDLLLPSEIEQFADDVYLHQVIARKNDNTLVRYEDLDVAIESHKRGHYDADEWRIHFHIPIYTSPQSPLETTQDHVLDLLDIIKDQPDVCNHYEMETYTWEVLPEEMRAADVVTQLEREYQWIFEQFENRGIVLA